MPERIKGPYKETGKRIPWDEIFESGDTFVFDPSEYTSSASVRSTGISYRNRNNLEGALHVVFHEQDADKDDGEKRLVVWFTPGEKDDELAEVETTA